VWEAARGIMQAFNAAAAKFVKEIDGEVELWAASRDWFLEEWGRDTFICLPGLLLATGRYDQAKKSFCVLLPMSKTDYS